MSESRNASPCLVAPVRDPHEYRAQRAHDCGPDVVHGVERHAVVPHEGLDDQGHDDGADAGEELEDGEAVGHVPNADEAEDEEALQTRGAVQQAEHGEGHHVEPVHVAAWKMKPSLHIKGYDVDRL